MTTTTRPDSKPLGLSNWQRATIVFLLVVLLCAVPTLAIAFVSEFPVLGNVFTAGLAACIIAASIWLTIREKRLSVFAVAILGYGSLLIVSTSIRDTYNVMIQPLSTDVRVEISRVIEIKSLARGIEQIGFAFLTFGIAGLHFQIWRKAGRSLKEIRMSATILMAGVYAFFGVAQIYMATLLITRGLRW